MTPIAVTAAPAPAPCTTNGRAPYRSVWNMMILSEPPSAVANACVAGYLRNRSSVKKSHRPSGLRSLFRRSLDDALLDVDDASVGKCDLSDVLYEELQLIVRRRFSRAHSSYAPPQDRQPDMRHRVPHYCETQALSGRRRHQQFHARWAMLRETWQRVSSMRIHRRRH